MISTYTAQRLRIIGLTSNCSGVMALNCAADSFTAILSFVPGPWALMYSALKTDQALEGVYLGAVRSAFSLRALTFSVLCFAACEIFCLSVRILFFGFGFALAFFFGLDVAFNLGLALALDFPLGIAFGAVLWGAGFLAAFVAEVVGALLWVADVLPVWAFGRDTGLSAYEREKNGE